MFAKISNAVACTVGHRAAFTIGLILFILLIGVGATMKFSDPFMLVTTLVLSILAILLLFPLQYSSNRDTTAINKKLDEIIRVLDKADDHLIEMEKKDQ